MNKNGLSATPCRFDHVACASACAVPNCDEGARVIRHLTVADPGSPAAIAFPVRLEVANRHFLLFRPCFRQSVDSASATRNEFRDVDLRIENGTFDFIRVLDVPR